MKAIQNACTDLLESISTENLKNTHSFDMLLDFLTMQITV